jgi:hypothetical protein
MPRVRTHLLLSKALASDRGSGIWLGRILLGRARRNSSVVDNHPEVRMRAFHNDASSWAQCSS